MTTPTNLGVGGGHVLRGSLSQIGRKIDRKDCCPLCNSIVAQGEVERIVIAGQAYHLYHLLKPGASKNGAKEEFVKFKERFGVLGAQEHRTADEDYEFSQLGEILNPKKKNSNN